MCSEQCRKAEDEREKEAGLKREKRTENIYTKYNKGRKTDQKQLIFNFSHYFYFQSTNDGVY